MPETKRPSIVFEIKERRAHGMAAADDDDDQRRPPRLQLRIDVGLSTFRRTDSVRIFPRSLRITRKLCRVGKTQL